jgi:hypothetical protein
MNLRNLAERIEFLCALKELTWFDSLREHTLNCDHQAAGRIVSGFFDSYGIVDPWLRDSVSATINYWFAFPESAAARLGHFVPVFPRFEPPEDPRELDARLNEFTEAWKSLNRESGREISDAALWTALRFTGKPAGAIARDYCAENPSKNPEAMVEKQVSRFAKRIGLTMPDHSRCAHNEFLARRRVARGLIG